MPARSLRPTCPADHPHAENSSCYLHHHCGCDDCRTAHNERARNRRRQLAYGRWSTGLVDASPVREHLAYLSRSGMGVRTVEAVSGVPRITLSRLIWGDPSKPGPKTPSKRVRASTAEILLAVQPQLELLADHALVDGRGTRRRLQALARCGWTYAAIGAIAGCTQHRISELSIAPRVTARNARMISDLYDRLWDAAPPTSTPTQRAQSERSRRRAIKMRWAGPLAWDNIDNDAAPVPRRRTATTDDSKDEDTSEQRDAIDVVAVDFATSGVHVRLTPAERREAVRILHRDFYSDGVIADRIGCDSKTVERIRDELKLTAHDPADIVTRAAA